MNIEQGSAVEKIDWVWCNNYNNKHLMRKIAKNCWGEPSGLRYDLSDWVGSCQLAAGWSNSSKLWIFYLLHLPIWTNPFPPRCFPSYLYLIFPNQRTNSSFPFSFSFSIVLLYDTSFQHLPTSVDGLNTVSENLFITVLFSKTKIIAITLEFCNCWSTDQSFYTASMILNFNWKIIFSSQPKFANIQNTYPLIFISF